MTSQVNPYNIDGTFPIAGQDNDSQGFRDNFTNTRNNFAFIKAEVEDLQAKAVLKSALTNTTLNNDLSATGTTLNHAQLTSYSETFTDNGSLTGAQAINYNNGNYQKITTGGSLNLSFTNWPTAGVAGRIRLWISVTSTAYTVTWPSAVTLGRPLEIAGMSNTGLVLTFDQTGDYLFEIGSSDNGVSFFLRDMIRSPDTIHSAIIKQYQFLTPTTGANVQINGFSETIIDPAGTIAALTITFPAVANLADGQTLRLSYGNTITATTFVAPNGGTIKGAPTTVANTASNTFIYRSVSNTWYRG